LSVLAFISDTHILFFLFYFFSSLFCTYTAPGAMTNLPRIDA
jgi:hypothetical protein